MNAPELLQNYLKLSRVMQIATVRGGKPWICTVYYVADDSGNLYWLSLPTRRHSQDIAENDKVAIAIVVTSDQPVIGIQAEGSAEVVLNVDSIKDALPKYIDKYGQGRDFYDNFLAGKNKHNLYVCRVKQFTLFDEANFPGGVGTTVKIEPIR